MNVDLSACWTFTAGWEGGYSSDAHDPGNWTGGACGSGRLVGSNYGVSAVALIHWLGAGNARYVTAAYMRGLLMSTAQAIFQIGYWNTVQGDALPAGIDLMTADAAYNMGPVNSGRLLQAALGLAGSALDGIIGPHTLAACQGADPQGLAESLAAAQTARYRQALNFDLYGQGWLDRTAARLRAATGMISGDQSAPVSTETPRRAARPEWGEAPFGAA